MPAAHACARPPPAWPSCSCRRNTGRRAPARIVHEFILHDRCAFVNAISAIQRYRAALAPLVSEARHAQVIWLTTRAIADYDQLGWYIIVTDGKHLFT